MKIKDGFILREIAGSNVVIPTGARTADLNGMISLNDTGAFIWRQLLEEKEPAQIVAAILDNYDVDPARAETCVNDFLRKLEEVGCIA